MKTNKLEYDWCDLLRARKQAVKETEERLALDWQDIELIDEILREIRRYHIYKKPYYQETLEIFNKERKQKVLL